MATVYRIYYTDPVDNKAYAWDEKTLTGALSITERFRKEGMTFVTMVSENTDLVGKQGVVGVENGKLPNGEKYEYTKRDALSQRTKINLTDEVVVNIDDE